MDPAMQRRPDLPPPVESMASKLNWLRAGVLGANDGIVSTSALMVGVAGAGTGIGGILTAGVAALVAGAFSMAVGEYVSVSSQRDSERAAIRRELAELESNPEGQIDQLAHMYEARGLAPATAHQVAVELTEADPLRAHLDVEYKLDPDDLNNPWSAAASSAVAFTLGSLVPLVAALVAPAAWMPWPIVVATVLALLVTGVVSARIGGSGKRIGMLRVLLGGILALAATWLIGTLVGTPVH
ncbi:MULTISPECIES: VIT family protein [Agrococcus]|uniref:VIT1/CCC1 transporter family protein n=1 Tax=Agrococcus TaxID=46352 RepID=UPI00285C6E75|nr:VIT family protein [Agrococcus sp. BE272]MDR7233297.1 VIT1/CCC1 family predicted Fe2+/Mn2+ transporter [Agrococcus sp. BE272]